MSSDKLDWTELLDVAYASDIGMRRSNNQDAFAVNMAGDMASWEKQGHLFVVADGMGAHAAGELASSIAAEKIPFLYRKYCDSSPPEAAKRAVIEANAEINRRGQANEEFHNMGTTCSVMALLPQGVIAAHVGDSRIYRLRGKRLEQLTFDHSLVWETREANRQQGRGEDISDMLPKNVITRSLGPFPDVKVDLEGPFPTKVGDTFLLCSDGLTNQITDAELGALLSNLTAADAAKVMVDISNLRGGPDNITLIIIRVTSKDITTEVVGSAPLKIGGKTGDSTPPVLAWVFFSVFVLGAIIAALLGLAFPAIASGIFAISTLGFILYKMFGNNTQREVSGGKRFGKGPYTRIDSRPRDEMINSMKVIVNDLRKAAVEENWKVDLDKLGQSVGEADKHVAAGKLDMAIRYYAKGMTNLMDQLRGNGS